MYLSLNKWTSKYGKGIVLIFYILHKTQFDLCMWFIALLITFVCVGICAYNSMLSWEDLVNAYIMASLGFIAPPTLKF